MVPSRYLFLAFGLLVCREFASAQTVVNSTFLNRYPQPANYSSPDNWSPAEVPNNSGSKLYNVEISPGYVVNVDIDATISNLNLGGAFTGLIIAERIFSVTGTTSNQLQSRNFTIYSSANRAARFNAGTLSTFSNNALTGNYSIYSGGLPATLQFQNASVSTLKNGTLSLSGPLAAMVDQFGNDALQNLARVESDATLSISGQSRVTNAPFSNEGSLFVGQGLGPSIFTATVSLTNFDPSTRTFTGGKFGISASDPQAGSSELRFNGADIVNVASAISLSGATARIADLAGNDGLRNLSRILPSGLLTLSQHNLAITGSFQNDGSLSLFSQSVFSVPGDFKNFDPITRTFSGGKFGMTNVSQLQFAGADIVHNASSITLSDAGTITDLAGNDGLRNFSDNLSNGEFTVGNYNQFTASGDFTTAGRVETIRRLFTFHQTAPEGKFSVASGFRYKQTGGATVNAGLLTAEHIDILAGTVSGSGTFVGDVTVTNSTIIPSSATIIQGRLTLGAGSHFHFQLSADARQEITGKVTLGGTLEVDIPSDSFVSSSTFLTVLKSAQPLSGVFNNAPNGARIPTTDGRGSVLVTYGSNEVHVSQYQAEPPPAQLLNISSRALLSKTTDDSFGDRAVIIGGFIVSGTAQKDIVLRALGPSLVKFALDPVLADPVLELHASDGSVIASNDNWKENQTAITASGLAPSNDREAALRVMLVPGTYTVVVKEKSGLAGYGLVEIYDLSPNTTSKLANISTRGFTDANSVLIGGIIVGGSGQANDDVVVRALGPQLRRNGILNALDDPTLEVRDENGNLVGFNDDWTSNSNQVGSTGLAPVNNSESAILLSLPRGSYTAIVRAKANSGGLALVEFYDLRR